jgi:hypothetical protein
VAARRIVRMEFSVREVLYPAKKRRHDHLGDVRAGRPVTQLVLKLSGRLAPQPLYKG